LGRNRRPEVLGVFTPTSLLVEDEWSETTHDTALSIDGGHMWLKWISGDVGNLRLGGAIRGKWRIQDGKDGVWSRSEIQSSKVGAPA
jgi:hypothetical protein